MTANARTDRGRESRQLLETAKVDLYRDLGKAFDLIWAASDNLTGGLDEGIRSPVEQRLWALQADFRSAEAAGDQAGMLRLAKEMAALGGDLVACRKEAVR